ncbi:MAG: hypothetical protein K9M99_11095 [Candidatus Cloacimonetes bacterium]|nr:hypothetical protein [Candidatus Cloacimonadota bacterium]
MKSVDRIDMNRKWPIPSWIPMLLLVAAVLGLLLGRCGHAARDKYIVFYNVEVQEATMANIDVTFEAYNRSKVDFQNEGILIRAYNEAGEEIASKITTIDLESGTHKRFLKVLTKLTKLIKTKEDVRNVTVELYHSSLFK